MAERLMCPQCSTIVDVVPGRAPVCPNCGFGSTPAAPPRPAPTPYGSPSAYAPSPPAASASPSYYQPPPSQGAPQPYQPVSSAPMPGDAAPVTQGLAIAALLLNVLLIPGVGSLVGRRKSEGIWQLVLFLAGIPLMLVLVGFFMLLGAWIWGLVTGIQIVQSAQN